MKTLKFVHRCIGAFVNKKSINVLTHEIKTKQSIYLFSTSCSNDNSIGEITRRWSTKFEEAGVPEPIESIEHIVAHIIGTSKITDLVNFKDKTLDPEQIKKLESLCECRLLRMPVQYIIGEWDFRDITLKLVPPVFIPRPETEILVDLLLKSLSNMDLPKYKVLEIGCGSGAITLALVHACKKIHCIAIDTNIVACNLTLENAKKLDLTDRLEIFNATLKEDGTIMIDKLSDHNTDCDFNSANQFDFIISNPPYIPTKTIFKLDPEIKLFEDIKALDGGQDGLEIIKPMLKYASVALKPGGRIFFELDPAQPDYVKFCAKNNSELKLKFEHTFKDFCSNERFVEVSKLSE